MRAISLLCLLVFSNSVLADQSVSDQAATTSVQVQELPAEKTNDLDEEVTDVKLRANSGSKSKYSVSLSLNYNGASLASPFDATRPNVSDERNADPVSMSGSVGVRYRFNKNESLFLATGVSKPRPFENREEDRFEVNTPMAHYNNTFAYDDLQVSSTFMGYYATREYMTRIGNLGSVVYDLTAISPFAQSRFQGGVSLSALYSLYDKDKLNGFDIRVMQMDYSISLSPTLKYRASDRLNFYTTISPLNYSHYRSESFNKLERSPVTQTVGAGFAVLRDFYLSPSLFFQPGNLTSNKTAVNLSAYINLF